MRLIADTACMITPDEAQKLGFTTLPLNVTIENKTYREYVDVDTPTFINMVKKGGIPVSSQPSVGEIMEEYVKSDEDTLVITMADGLSGTYQGFISGKLSVENNDKIHVFNSRTLAGPEKQMVLTTLEMMKAGKNMDEILEKLEFMQDHHCSCLIPADFDFLMRGGRLNPVAAKIGGLVRIVPVVMESKDGRVLEKFTIKRTLKNAVSEILDHFKDLGIDENYTVWLCHAGALDTAEKIKGWIQESLPMVKVVIDDLTPAFVTQGGPGCCSVQMIHN